MRLESRGDGGDDTVRAGPENDRSCSRFTINANSSGGFYPAEGSEYIVSQGLILIATTTPQSKYFIPLKTALKYR